MFASVLAIVRFMDAILFLLKKNRLQLALCKGLLCLNKNSNVFQPY